MTTPPADPDRTQSLKNTYIGVVIVEVIVMALLWWLGRSFS